MIKDILEFCSRFLGFEEVKKKWEDWGEHIVIEKFIEELGWGMSINA